MHQAACSKLRKLRDGVNYASKYGKRFLSKIPGCTAMRTICGVGLWKIGG